MHITAFHQDEDDIIHSADYLQLILASIYHLKQLNNFPSFIPSVDFDLPFTNKMTDKCLLYVIFYFDYFLF